MFRQAAVLIAYTLLLAGAACADEPRLQQLHHTVWTTKDGLPDDVSVISQSPDGLLWLGTSGGLYRFDGAAFEKFEPLRGSFPDQDTYTLQAAPDGSIWVGWRLNGLSRIRGEEVTSYTEADGIHRGSIWGFAFEKNGNVWAAGLRGVSRFDGKRWERIGPAHGFTGNIANAVFVDQDGTVAIFSEKGLFLKRSAEREFRGPVGSSNAYQPPVQGKDGRIYLMDGSTGIRAIDSLERYGVRNYPWAARYPDGQNGNMLIASDNTLWFNVGNTLYRQQRAFEADAKDGAAATSAQSINHVQGLSGETTYFIFEDREQNVWVATNKGLDRFRKASVLPLEIDSAVLRLQQASVLAKPDGGLLLFRNAEDGGRLELSAGGSIQNVVRGEVRSAFYGADGALWTASAGALHKHGAAGKRELSATLPKAMAAKGFIHAIAEGSGGAVWVSIVRSGVRIFKDGSWSEPVRSLYQEGQATALSLNTTPGGKVLLGYADNHAAIVDGSRTRIYGAEQGLALQQVAHMAEVQGVVWASGGQGAAFLKDERFHLVTLADGRTISGASCFMEGAEGSLWFNTKDGLILIAAEEVRQTVGRPGYRPRYRTYGRLDGAMGSISMLSQQSCVVDRQGRLWFTTTYGVFRIDPKKLVEYRAAARPLIQRASLGERVVRSPAALQLSPSERDLRIDFTSATLSVPERVRFRYRLHGYNNAWEDVGTRRQAFFTGLPPGTFRFEVAATNPEGEWGAPVALEVSVQPRYFQTLWFQCLAVLLFLLSLYLLHRFRLRVVEGRVRKTMEVKQAERERIARELHDTLLQGVQGLILRLQALAMKAAPEDPVRGQLEPILQRADEMLAEGREKVHDLRAPDLLHGGLGAALQRVGDDLSLQTGLEFCVTITGSHRVLHPDCDYDLYRIGAEALSNAFRHSGGTRVTLKLVYAASGLSMTVADNGQGISPQVLDAGRAGHYGLPGMHERAAHAGATLEVSCAEGTQVTLHVPASQAYG